MNLAHTTDGARLNKLHNPAVIRPGVNLRAHLRHELVPARDLGHNTSFIHAVGKRLFAVAMLAEFHGRHAGRGVRMIRRADDHGVNSIVNFVEHPAKVRVSFGPWVSLERLRRVFLIHVAQRHNILTGPHAIDISRAAPANPNPSHVQPFVGLRAAYHPAIS